MNNTSINILETALIGKKLTHKNRYYREVSLEIESVKIKKHHIQITPDTRENDGWGESCDFETIEITFIDGSSINVSLDTELIITT